MKPKVKTPYFGLMAEFMTAEALVHAAHETHKAGYRRIDAYSPFPVEELHEALHIHSTRLPLVVLLGGIFGALAGYGMQYWMSVIDYPLNIGGKPYHSWPSFIPVTFETTVLFAAFAAVFGMLALNGLPMPYHPVFNVEAFEHASRDRFFLCIMADDPKFDGEKTRHFLESFHPQSIAVVEH
jgi:hypothetical protein